MKEEQVLLPFYIDFFYILCLAVSVILFDTWKALVPKAFLYFFFQIYKMI